MISIVVDDCKMVVDGHADDEDLKVSGIVCGIVSSLSQSIGELAGGMTTRPGYTRALLPTPGDPVREFVLKILRELARDYPNQLNMVERSCGRDL